MTNFDKDNQKKAWDLVFRHFNWNLEKTIYWFMTPNPILGMVTPILMITSGRSEKLLTTIQSMLAGEGP